ncbi:MAG TPA: hypothetical protein VFZ61_21250 [Polyangiales bacterium]
MEASSRRSRRSRWGARVRLARALALSWLLLGPALSACSVGHGRGEITGTLTIDGCKNEGAYSLAPDAFFADTAEQLLSLRVQRGGDIETYSDGIAVLVKNAGLLKQERLGQDIDLSARAEPLVAATAYFNETCFTQERTKVPALLEAVSGSIRFDAIYAPRVDKDDVRITATLDRVVFRDVERPTQRWAELSGYFDFLYVRGRPAQHFP